MKDIVALDPGARNAGLAIVVGGRVTALVSVSVRGPTHVADTAARLIRALPADVTGFTLVSEWPRKYQSNRRAWPEVEALRAVVEAVELHGSGRHGRLGGVWASTRRVAPGAWARTVPKHIRAMRTAAAIEAANPGALEALSWDEHTADARDAAGLALWALAQD